MRNKFRKFSLLIAAIPLVGSPCFAGTGGIFPANNPRRKIQYTAPIDSPTSIPQNAAPRQRQLLPSLPSTAGSVSEDNKSSSSPLPLHGMTPTSTTSGTSEGKSASENNGDVASFFKVNANAYSRTADSATSKSELKLDAQLEKSTTDSSTKSIAGAPFRFVWHVLDNAGVPMFVGKRDADLDPSLRKGYAGMNSIPLSDPQTPASAPPATRVPNKIPASELEGTKNSVDDNDQMP